MDSEVVANLSTYAPAVNLTSTNNDTNLLLASFPLKHTSDWGPKRDPLFIVVPITVIYIIIFITGVLGNVSTCIVIAKNRSMHTATNYYLFSLAVSDLLMLLSALPNEMYVTWYKYPYIFGEQICILQGFAAETSANATVLTITAFTVERYLAICHPFFSHTLSKLSRALKLIVVIWLVAISFAIPQALAFGIYYERLPDGRMTKEDHYVCTYKRLIIPHAFEISTFLFFVAPMCLITVLYILIGLQLHRSTVGPSRGGSVRLKHRIYSPVVSYKNPSGAKTTHSANGDETENVQLTRQDEDGRKNFSRNAQASKHVVKMLIAVVVAFFVCWAPFHAQRLLAIYGQPSSPNMISAFRILTYISGILYYLSTTVNPLLYHIMSNKYREAFKETFREFFGNKKESPNTKCYTTLSARSSQLNSHSNTDSCSRQSSLRYLDMEMARLHESKRPVVVSFRRKKPTMQKHVTVFDEKLQEALENLKEQPHRRSLYQLTEFDRHIPLKVGNEQRLSVYHTCENIREECSFIELHSLQPRHICPVSVSYGSVLFPTCNVQISNEFKHKGQTEFCALDKCRNRANSFKYEGTMANGLDEIAPPLSKSSTMPHMQTVSHVLPLDDDKDEVCSDLHTGD